MIRWERLGALAQPFALLGAFALIVWGVWGINVNAGRIALGVALAVVLYLVDRPDPADAADPVDSSAVRTGVLVR